LANRPTNTSQQSTVPYQNLPIGGGQTNPVDSSQPAESQIQQSRTQ
jgi:hypothetical protein